MHLLFIYVYHNKAVFAIKKIPKFFLYTFHFEFLIKKVQKKV